MSTYTWCTVCNRQTPTIVTVGGICPTCALGPVDKNLTSDVKAKVATINEVTKTLEILFKRIVPPGEYLNTAFRHLLLARGAALSALLDLPQEGKDL